MKIMRMQKEEKIVVVLLFMALGSLAVAFWTLGPEEGDADGDSAAAKENSLLSLEGSILEIKPTNTGGNLLLQLDSTTMPVFIPASAGAGELREQLHAGDLIRVRGKVADFHGSEELKISRASDVQRLER
jgi:hypothetical protein